MSAPQRRSTVVVVDNADPDNSVAALAACNPLLGLNVRAVIVTGRPATRDRQAAIDTSDPHYSAEVLRRNTRRMKGLLRRAGYGNVPVFEGLIPPNTIVPHLIHIDEVALDRYNDYQNTSIDGSFARALKFLARLEGPIDFIVGGPLTEVAAIMQNPSISPRLGALTCQLGLFGFGDVQTMAGEDITFNSAADPDATRAVLLGWRGALGMVSTDITKLPAVGFDNPESVRRFGLPAELVRLYEVFYRVALAPRGERIYPHDVHSVFLMAQLRKALAQRVYTSERVCITGVGPKGQIAAKFGNAPRQSKRFVVKHVDSQAFMRVMAATLRTR